MHKKGLSQRTTPVFLKKQLFLVKNYRPVSVFPAASKSFEKNNAKTDYQLHEPISSPLICGYRKGFITQTALVYLTEKWNFMLDKK